MIKLFQLFSPLIFISILSLSGSLSSWNVIEATSPSQHVITLTDDNINQHILDGNEWLVEFYADWCGYCQRFNPIYQEIAKELRQSNPSVRVGQINADGNSISSTRFLITRLPTLFHIKNNEVREVKLKFDKETIVEWIQEEGWKTVQPWAWWWSPLSWFGSLISIIGWIPKRFTMVSEYLNQYMPLWAAYTVMAVSFFGGLIYIISFIPVGPPPEAARLAAKHGIHVQRIPTESKSSNSSDADKLNGKATSASPSASTVNRRKRD